MTRDQLLAFEQICAYRADGPLESCLDVSTTFQLETDVSNTQMYAVQSQTIGGVEHVVSFASRSLSYAAKNYSRTEKECLTVTCCVTSEVT